MNQSTIARRFVRSATRVFLPAFGLVAGCSSGGGDVERASRALESGRPEEAFQVLARAVIDTPDSPEAHRLMARACLHTFRTTPGARSAARAVELAPEDAEAHFLRALLNLRRLRLRPAKAAAERAVELAPDELRYRVALAEIHLAEGLSETADYEAALEELEHVLVQRPDHDRARFAYGKALILGGRHADGEREIDRFLAARPGGGEAYYLRGLARLRRRAFEEAERDFRLAIVLQPELPASYFNLSRVLRMTRRVEESELVQKRFEEIREAADYIESVELSYHSESGDIRAAMEYARVLATTSRIDDAVVILESLCADQEIPAANVLLTEVALEGGYVNRALRVVRRFLASSPRNAEANHLRAQVEVRAGRAAEGVPFAREAVRLAPKEARFRLTLGEVLLETGNPEEASRVFEEALELDPQPRAWAGLGRALFETGSAREAERALSTALGRRPRRHAWLCERGRVQVALGDLASAEDDFRKAVALAPHYPPSYRELAEVLRATGRLDEATSMDDTHRLARERERKIEALFAELDRIPPPIGLAERLAALFEESGRENEARRILSRAFALGVEP